MTRTLTLESCGSHLLDLLSLSLFQEQYFSDLYFSSFTIWFVYCLPTSAAVCRCRCYFGTVILFKPYLQVISEFIRIQQLKFSFWISNVGLRVARCDVLFNLGFTFSFYASHSSCFLALLAAQWTQTEVLHMSDKGIKQISIYSASIHASKSEWMLRNSYFRNTHIFLFIRLCLSSLFYVTVNYATFVCTLQYDVPISFTYLDIWKQ